MVRSPVRFVPCKDRKAVTAGLKAIYLAPSAESAAEALDELAGVRDTKYPMIAKSWRNRWNEVMPFFDGQGLPLLGILTDRGSEYCGKRERHEYEPYLDIENIEHTKTKGRHPQTNGTSERKADRLR
jgi:hypothetical protein